MALRVGQRIKVENLELELVHAGMLRLSGSLSSTAARIEVRQLLEALHERVTTLKAYRFVVDARELDFMDSSAIRLFMDWLKKASASEYKLVFYIDPDVTWHRLSFGVLQSLSPAWVEVTDEVTGITRMPARAS
jgi:anti-anti-sigma regulatory factor